MNSLEGFFQTLFYVEFSLEDQDVSCFSQNDLMRIITMLINAFSYLVGFSF
jgi:hypothetical protein